MTKIYVYANLLLLNVVHLARCMHLYKGKMKSIEQDLGRLTKTVNAISEIGNELSVPNLPLPECDGCQYRLLDKSMNRQECFYKFIEKTTSNCKGKGHENKTTAAALL